VTRILLVDPDEALAQALRTTPQLEGTSVDVAAGDADALHRLRALAYEVVLTSPRTPVEEDLAFLEEARLARPGVRPIVLSEDAAPEQVIAALRSRVFAFFSAPWDVPEIVDMTRRALEATGWHEGIEVVSALPEWIALRVNCGLLSAERLVRFLTELRRDVPEADRDGALFAFREILLNAMEHGGGFNPGLVVEVSAVRTERTIVYYVKDPGSGFDPARLLHAASASGERDLLAHVEERERLGMRPGGFGLLLARKIVDEMILSERGNEVLLIKHVL
jgi:CheY-like chemotaxis protein/anti-sigma regulatory factor (Ser/Thr protein kinase)